MVSIDIAILYFDYILVQHSQRHLHLKFQVFQLQFGGQTILTHHVNYEQFHNGDAILFSCERKPSFDEDFSSAKGRSVAHLCNSSDQH